MIADDVDTGMQFARLCAYGVHTGACATSKERTSSTNWRSIGFSLEIPQVGVFGQYGLEHIAKRHADVTNFDLLWLPLVIESELVSHAEKPDTNTSRLSRQ